MEKTPEQVFSRIVASRAEIARFFLPILGLAAPCNPSLKFALPVEGLTPSLMGRAAPPSQKTHLSPNEQCPPLLVVCYIKDTRLQNKRLCSSIQAKEKALLLALYSTTTHIRALLLCFLLDETLKVSLLPFERLLGDFSQTLCCTTVVLLTRQ